MKLITIPKKLIERDDLIVLPRKDYEALLSLAKVKDFMPTSAQKKALQRAENNLRDKKTLSYNELIGKLGFTDRS